ncbi:MAG: hypothetical protein R3275_12865 [Saprospiraceae bacterium]|nr:hypothetical protein [Saprospiraceae bacterium]
MAAYIEKIEEYTIMTSGYYPSGGGWEARISLILPDKFVYFYFMTPGKALKSIESHFNRFNEEIVKVYFRYEQFRDIVDLLRNEEPVYLFYSGQLAYLTTSREPVGEGEL